MTPIAEMAAKLRGIAQRTANMAPMLRVIARDVETEIDNSFERTQTLDGSAWPELSEVTLMQRARKARGFTTNRTLGPLPASEYDTNGNRRRHARKWTRRVAERVSAAVFGAKAENDTGRLRRSITTRVDARSLFFGSNVVYAAKQNFGDASNKFGGHPAPVPARRFLPLTADGTQLAPQAFWDDARARLSHWLATGEVT